MTGDSSTTSGPVRRPWVHFTGVGGKGIAPAAGLALQAGWTVTGDDLHANHRTQTLAAAGATITTGSNAVPDGCDYLVSSTAVSGETSLIGRLSPRCNPGRDLHRLEFVQHVADRSNSPVVAVAGSFGKSTAAALCLAALRHLDPSCYIGADVPDTLCGGRHGTGPATIVEACEYLDAYEALYPTMMLLLNIEPNHEDFFGTGTDGFARSFTRFAQARSTDLPTILTTTAVSRILLRDHGFNPRRLTVIGEAGADWRATITNADPISTSIAVAHHRARVGQFRIPAAGRHLVLAATAAVAIAQRLGLNTADIRAGLDTFQLPARRMSVLHTDPRLVLVDDNARHPHQIRTVTAALRQRFPDHELHLIVSPWGRKNARNLQPWADALTSIAGAWLLPVGDCGPDHGGAEDPLADQALAKLITANGGHAHLIDGTDTGWRTLMQAVTTAPRPCVVATVGYDAHAPVFAAAREILLTTVTTTR